MRSTFHKDDVTLLLKDISGMVEPLPASAREPRIQRGVHYSEMLPLEYVPTPDYVALFETALDRYSALTARAVCCAADRIVSDKGDSVVLVSLARAGISVGILLKKRIRQKYGFDPDHFAISIIRGRGIDSNAMASILRAHRPGEIQFVDGWTGKGAIQRELDAAMLAYPGVNAKLAVLSDPAGVSGICGTHEDFLIASSCLNSTVSGLISRTFLRSDIIGAEDFHGAAFYGELASEDRTYEFIDKVEEYFDAVELQDCQEEAAARRSGLDEVREIASCFGLSDINLIKPGIGEATRVLLRRVPWKILVSNLEDEAHLGHLYQLAKEKDVPVELYPLKNYRACGIIKEMADS